MIFWKRPSKQSDLENNFFYRLKTEGDSFRSSVKLQGQSAALQEGDNVAVSCVFYGKYNPYKLHRRPSPTLN
jgi:hypothetical protein